MFFKILRVQGHSMEPVIKNQQKVLCISYLFSKPKRRDVIAFKFGNKIFVKRIKKIEKGKYFMSGDNKTDSLDSRKLGMVGAENILGKIYFLFNNSCKKL